MVTGNGTRLVYGYWSSNTIVNIRKAEGKQTVLSRVERPRLEEQILNFDT